MDTKSSRGDVRPVAAGCQGRPPQGSHWFSDPYRNRYVAMSYVFSCAIVPKTRSMKTVRFLLLIQVAVLAACRGGSPTDTGPQPPAISIEGVVDDAEYDGAVTILISVDRGSYEASLNGESFHSGTSVSTPGAHELRVEARAGEATSIREVGFRIVVRGESMLIVRLIDLGDGLGGGGDAILFSDSSGAGTAHVMIDAGPAGIPGSQSVDEGFVLRRLRQLGVDSLEALILTHAHADHFGGMDSILATIQVKRFVYNGQNRSLGMYNALLTRAQASAAEVVVPFSILDLALGAGDARTSVEVLPPLPDYLDDPGANSTRLNDGSLGTTVTRGTFRMFATGDGEVEANQRWRTQFASRTAGLDILKVGHHGANNGIFDNGFNGSSLWLEHTDPDVAVISANGRSHPRSNALTRLLGMPATRTFCTNVHGEIVIRVNPEGYYEVTVEKNGDADCVPGSEADT